MKTRSTVCPICKGYGDRHAVSPGPGDRHAPLHASSVACGLWAVYESNDLPRWPLRLSQRPTRDELEGPDKIVIVQWKLINPRNAEQVVHITGRIKLSKYLRLPAQLTIEAILRAIKN
jgi:hypothetical protein